MNEILNKLQTVLQECYAKLHEIDNKLKEVNNTADKQAVFASTLADKEKELKIREAAVSYIEDVERLNNETKSLAEKVANEKKELKISQDAFVQYQTLEGSVIRNKEAQLNEGLKNLKEAQEQLAKDKETYKENILKEIKAKFNDVK